jgi:hypothetical protein
MPQGKVPNVQPTIQPAARPAPQPQVNFVAVPGFSFPSGRSQGYVMTPQGPVFGTMDPQRGFIQASTALTPELRRRIMEQWQQQQQGGGGSRPRRPTGPLHLQGATAPRLPHKPVQPQKMTETEIVSAFSPPALSQVPFFYGGGFVPAQFIAPTLGSPYWQGQLRRSGITDIPRFSLLPSGQVGISGQPGPLGGPPGSGAPGK